MIRLRADVEEWQKIFWLFGKTAGECNANINRMKAQRAQLAAMEAVVERLKRCPNCTGSGYRKPEWASGEDSCSRCNGYGWIFYMQRQPVRDALAALDEARKGDGNG